MNGHATSRRRSWARGPVRSKQSGFTVIEVTIAIALFALIAAFTSSLLASSMRGVLLSKRREVATLEANKVLELARSVSYNSLGLSQNDDPTIATDSAIQTPAGGVRSYLVGSTLEPIVWDTSGAGGPLNPHQLQICPSCVVKRGSTKLTRYVYVTGVDTSNPPDGTFELKRMTVLVSWDPAGTVGQANSVRAQTLVNPEDIVNKTGLVPQTSSTSSSGGSATVSNGLILPATPVTVSLPTTSGSSSHKSVSTTNCTGNATSISGLTNTYGGNSVSVTADDDAQSPTPSSPAPQQWSTSNSVGGATDLEGLLVGAPITSSGSCTAIASDHDGQPPTDDGLPYERGTSPAAVSMNLTTGLTGAGLPSNPVLTALSVSPHTVTQEIDHQDVNGSREVLSTASSGQGPLKVLMIPGVFDQGLASFDAMSYTAAVRSAEGLPSSPPTVTAPSTIVLHIFDPLPRQLTCTTRTGDYCNINVDPHVGVSKRRSGSVTRSLTTLTYDVQIDVLPPAADPANGVDGPNGERRWSAQYIPISLTARLTVRVGALPIVLTDTLVHVDFGSVSASACAGVTC
jgi:prepilin-type N-terminal cleavage/methylation domain-containing protein